MQQIIKTAYPVPRLITSPNLFAGEKALMALKGVACSRVLLLTGQSLANELREEIKKSLSAETVIEVSRPTGGDPSFDSVQLVWDILDGRRPDCIVAVGGGAVLDLAKLLLLWLEWPNATLERMKRPFALPPLKKRTKLVAIPTTAGSGSEVSSAALILDASTQTKMAIVSHDFIADVSLLDPRFLRTIPRSIMVAGMIDAMTHAVEGYLSSVANPIADALAESTVSMLGRYAFQWLEGGEQNLSIIQNLQIASHQAGIVQNQCGVGICHSLAHQMARFGVGHGEANGLFLREVLRFNCQDEVTKKRLAYLMETANVMIPEWLQKMQEAGGLATTLWNIPAAQKMDHNQIAQDALQDICTRFNPRPVVEEDFLDLLARNLDQTPEVSG